MNHALRDLPHPFRRATQTGIDLLRYGLLGSHLYDFNYYRRAVRQNELFFIASGDEIDRLYEAVLEAVRQPGGLQLAY